MGIIRNRKISIEKMKLALGFVGFSAAAPRLDLPDGLVFPCKDICLGGELKENLVDCGTCLYRNWKPCEDGIYPHEENCNQFYTCINGKRLPDITCPGSMLFNPETSMCGFANSVECHVQFPKFDCLNHAMISSASPNASSGFQQQRRQQPLRQQRNEPCRILRFQSLISKNASMSVAGSILAATRIAFC